MTQRGVRGGGSSLLLSIAGGCAVGVAVTGRSWVSVVIGALLLLSAFILHRRQGGGALQQHVVSSVIAAGIGMVFMFGVKTYRDHSPRRDVTRDAEFAARGVLVRAEVGEAYRQVILSNTGTTYRYCGSIQFEVVASDAARTSVRGTRCDLTPALVSALELAKGTFVEVLYLPTELQFLEARFDPFGNTAYLLDFRYIWELDADEHAQALGRPQAEVGTTVH